MEMRQAVSVNFRVHLDRAGDFLNNPRDTLNVPQIRLGLGQIVQLDRMTPEYKA